MPQVATPKGIKFEVSEELADEFRQALSRKKIGYSEGAAALMEWFTKQDGMLQSLILGQVDEDYHGQVAKLVLERVVGGKGLNCGGYDVDEGDPITPASPDLPPPRKPSKPRPR